MNKKIEQKYFNQSSVKIAPDLLGKYLVRKIGNKTYELPITEVEAYEGFEDKASHAHRGKTERNKVMFGHPGYWYVYLCYGMHWMLNIVTGPKGHPAAILIRGAGDLKGPARLTKFLKLNKSMNGKKATPGSGLWIEDRGEFHSPTSPTRPPKINKGPRIGVDYAGPVWSKKHYRFWIDLAVVVTLLPLLLLASCSQNRSSSTSSNLSPSNLSPNQVTMKLTSPAFNNEAYIPAQYTCDGRDVSPELDIAEIPAGTKSIVLIVDDPDAPVGDWVHWTLWNIDPSTVKITENSIPAGAVQGITDSGKPGWGGPCPPSGTHRYFFKLYALDRQLELSPEARKKDIEKAMDSFVLAQATLMGRYSRK